MDEITRDISTAGPIPGFWKRQFSGRGTWLQLAFDLSFGIVLPLVCFAVDYHMYPGGNSVMGKYAMFGYASFTLLGALLLCFLLLKRRLKVLSAIVAGALLWGAASDFVIGCILFPLSLLGLLIFLGILGFVPFFTAFTLLRNGIRALAAVRREVGPGTLSLLVLVGLATVLVPWYANSNLNKTIETNLDAIIAGDPSAVSTATERLARWRWFVDSDKLLRAYANEEDQVRRKSLEDAYRTITGREIQYTYD